MTAFGYEGVEAMFLGGGIVCCCLWIVSTAWMVIGFLLYSVMTENENESGCMGIVLIWSIRQAIETLGGCGLCVLGTFFCVSYCIEDDD